MAGGVPQTARLGSIVCVLVASFISGIPAFAQTTVVLNTPNTQVLDTMIRNGAYTNVNNDGPLLLTRFSTIPDWERRSIFSFEAGSIPAGVAVTSAVLTLTVKSGLGAANATRPVTIYRLTAPFTETQATWNSRQTSVPWTTAGGDLGESYGTVAVTNVAGARVAFNVTALVQQTVNGAFGSPQVRIALIDVGAVGDEKDSYREYHASEASTVGNRPSLTVTYSPTNTIDVPAGGDLQLALNAVSRGGTVRLASGATYVGNFTLPAKAGSSYITLTTKGVSLPPAGTRIDPSYRVSLGTIRSPNEWPALATAAAGEASYYKIVGVAFSANQDGLGDVIALGDSAQTSLSQVPHHLEIDRVLISGDAAVGQKRGIAVNAKDVVIMNSDIRDIKAVGQDSQAICGWNTPGPITVRNNYLEAAGENMMIGGAEIKLPNIVPSDILVEDNLMAKNPLWRGTSWTVKNIFELKSGRRVTVRRNTFEYNWSGAQPGYAIVFTPRNSGGRSPWVAVEDVDFVENVVRHSGSAFNLLGHDDTGQSGQLARIKIRNNLVYDISSTAWGGGGIFAQIGGEPRDITIDHNTIVHNGNAITFYFGTYYNGSNVKVTAGPMQGFVFTNNFLKHNSYGIFGSGQAYGIGTLNYYAPGAIVRRNVLAGGQASRYPADNFFPPTANFLPSFVNASVFDYRLVTGSPYVGAGLDGLDVGCTVAAVFARAQ